MTTAELDRELRTILARLEMVSVAPTQAFNPGGGKTDDGDGAPAGTAHTPADHYRVRLAGVQTGLQRRLDAAEATGDTDQREAEERAAHDIAHEQRETILTDAQREWKHLTGRDGETPRARTADLDSQKGIEDAIRDEAPGKPADDVAAKLGLTVFSVRRRYVEMGLDPTTGEPLPVEGDDLAGRVRDLKAKGLTSRQIAQLLNLHQTQVMRYLGRAA